MGKVDDNSFIKVTIGGANIWNSLFTKSKSQKASKFEVKNGILTYVSKAFIESWKLGIAHMVICIKHSITICIVKRYYNTYYLSIMIYIHISNILKKCTYLLEIYIYNIIRYKYLISSYLYYFFYLVDYKTEIKLDVNINNL